MKIAFPTKKMIKTLPIIVVAFLSFIWIFSVQASTSTEWPAFHGDSARTGFSDSKIPASANLLWEITTTQLKDYGVTDFEIFSPIIEGGKVFFSSGQTFAVDLYSGKIIWNYKGDRPDFYGGPPAAGGGKIFIRSEGFIYALDANTGTFLWKYQTKKQITHSNPVFAEGKVFVGDEYGSVYAIDAKAGKLVWQQQLEAYQIHSSPAYDAGIIYVGTETTDDSGGRSDKGSYLYALDAKDGKALWRFESDWRSNTMPNLIHGTPAILNGVVYFGSENGWFYALNKDNGQVIWKKIITKGTKTSARQAAGPGLVGISTAPALGYGKIFVGTWEGKFLALSQKDGAIVWEYNYGNEGTDSSAVLADGKVCLGSHYLDFYCFNQENGTVVWKEKLGGPSAALSDGILVVPNALAGESPGSILVAFSDKGLSTPTPSFDNRNFQIAVVFILGLVLVAVCYRPVKSRKITIKQLLIYGGIPVILIAGGYIIYSNYLGARKTEQQDTLVKEGKIDQATGSLISDDGVKYVEYQGKKYLIDGGYCARSRLARFAISVKRFNGTASADGQDGNTMYAIGSKDAPEYIDSSKVGDAKRDCWKREAN